MEKVFYQIFSKNDLYLAKSSQKIEFFFGVNSPFFFGILPRAGESRHS